MANILDEQERKRRELAAQGIRTKGVAGAQGGAAEVGYVPPSRRNAPINQIPPQNASPQADYARSAEGGAMIPSDKVGQANMLASMPNHGSLKPFEQPADTWIQRSRDFTQSRVGGTNQQLQQARQEMGTNEGTSLTQMVSQLDPSIKRDAERAREWRIMSPQQRRAEVDRLLIEQDAMTADQMIQKTPEEIQKYARDLADSTGTFIDSYGRSSPMYSPDTQIRIRNHQREIEKEVADGLSGIDKTKWKTEKDMYAWIASLPSTQRAGEFGKAIAFNIVRRYSTPQMKAQMEAEDRNQNAFEQAFTAKAAEEIIQRMAQEGKVSQKYAQGYRFTNDGSKELATQIWLNRDSDPRAGQIVNEIMANAPVMWMEEGGRVVQDPAHQERRRMMLEERKNKMAEKSKKDERDAAIRAEHIRYSGIQRTNPEYAKNMQFNEVTGKYDDFNNIVPGKEETNWDEIYQNNDRIAATEATLSWARFTNEEEAAAEAARQFPIDPKYPPTDAINQKALYDQQQAVKVWRTQVNPPEKRAELERELYNLKLRAQELRKGFKSPPAPEPTSGGYGLTMDSLGIGNQARQDQYSPVSVLQQPQTPPSITPNPAIQSQQTGASSGRAGSSSPDRLSPDQIEEYEKTGKLVLNEEQLGNKVPILVKRKGDKRKVELLSPDEVIQIAKTSVMPIRIPDIDSVNLDKKTIDAIRNQLNKENPLGPSKEPYSDHYVKWYWSQKMRKYYEAVVEKANNEKYFA